MSRSCLHQLKKRWQKAKDGKIANTICVKKIVCREVSDRIEVINNFRLKTEIKAESNKMKQAQKFITRITRILFRKAYLYKSIRFIFTCEKSLYSRSEWRTAVFTCGSITNQRQRKCL